MSDSWDSLRAKYDKVAHHYAEQFYGELSKKPFDRELLDQFAKSMRNQGRVCEIGCGPGQIARYLKDKGVDIFGLDLSSNMVAQARTLNKDIDFECGDMLSLDAPDEAWAGIVAFYSIIHLSHEIIPQAFREFRRVLQPGGRLMLAFHGGQGEAHADDWFGEGVSVTATLFEKEEIARSLGSAGFEVENTVERPPYDFEYPTRRIYLFARRKICSPAI